MLESNIEEEETSKSRKEKPSYFIFTSCSCSGRAFTHIFTRCEIMPLFIFSSLQVFVNYATAVYYTTGQDLIGTTFFRLVLPSWEDSLFGRSYWTDNAKTYNTHSREHERKLGIFRYHGWHLLTEDAAFLWKVKTRQIMFSWKSHSDSRRYFALY